MQKRIDTPRRGVAVLFHKDALQCVQKYQARWRKPVLVHVGWINEVETVAARSPLWPKHMTNEDLAAAWWAEPDLTAELLCCLRRKWAMLERSKAGKLKKFMAQNTCAKWPLKTNKPKPDKMGNVCLWDLQDQEIEIAFENSPVGVPVEIDDVTKARKWVAANVLAGEKYAKRVLDVNGFLDLKHRLRRAK